VAILDNDDLQIIGQAYAEGATAGTEKQHMETYVYNYTQIFRLPFGVTGSQDASENYTGKDRPRLRSEFAVMHKIDIERQGLFGERNLFTTGVASTNAPLRLAGGFLYFATTNLQDASGTLTESELETFAQTTFAHTASGNTRVLFASPLLVSVIDQLAAGRLQIVPREKTFGVAIKEWVTAHGTFLIAKHRLLENGANGSGYAGYGLAVDPKKIGYVYLRGRDTKLKMDIQANDADKWTDEYFTECSWEIKNPGVHAVLYGVTG
jgi:hypothetical protein